MRKIAGECANWREDAQIIGYMRKLAGRNAKKWVNTETKRLMRKGYVRNKLHARSRTVYSVAVVC